MHAQSESATIPSKASAGGSRSCLLRGARVALGAETSGALDVEVRAGRIAQLCRRGELSRPCGFALNLEGFLILPGLINAHDHLEFGLFPRLGKKRYANAKVWAEDIYQPNESPIREHLQISKAERLLWGALRNLLSGVTTVCHHNPYDEAVFDNGFPVRVVKRFGWAHSLAFSPDLGERFRQTPASEPFVVHLGEATDAPGYQEIFDLDRLGALNERTVLVHAVALDDDGWALARHRGASIVWCPSSNLFVLGQTVDRRAFDSNILTALGTDSGISAHGTLLDEIAIAREAGRLSAERLYAMVTQTPASVLRLNRGEGTLAEDGAANLVVVPDRGLAPADALLDLNDEDIQLVMVEGEIKLLAADLGGRADESVLRRLNSLTVDGSEVRLAGVDCRALLRSAKSALGNSQPFRLAGRLVEF